MNNSLTIVRLMEEKLAMFKELETEELFNQELVKNEKDRDIEIINLFKKQVKRNIEDLKELNKALIPLDFDLAVIMSERLVDTVRKCNKLTEEVYLKTIRADYDNLIKKVENDLIDLQTRKGNTATVQQLMSIFGDLKKLHIKNKGH